MAESIKLNVQGMTCGGCVRTVQTIIRKALDIDAADVKVELDSARATFPAPENVALLSLLEKLDARGFPSTKQA